MLRNIGFLLVLTAGLTTFFACNEEKQVEHEVGTNLNAEDTNKTVNEQPEDTTDPASKSAAAKLVYFNLSSG